MKHTSRMMLLGLALFTAGQTSAAAEPAPVLVFDTVAFHDSLWVPVTHAPRLVQNVTSCIASPNLPIGLRLNSPSCKITGTPRMATATAAYEIIATGPGGTVVQVLTLAVGPQTPAGETSGEISEGASGESGGNSTGTPDRSNDSASNGVPPTPLAVTGRPGTYSIPFPAGNALEGRNLALSVFDVWGRAVWTQIVQPADIRAGKVSWNGRKANGLQASPGLYIARIAPKGPIF